jgi:hypothetical protein
MKKINKFLIVCIVLLFALSACKPVSAPIKLSASAGNQYYVSPSGSDTNTGTIDVPFKTIQHGITVMLPGDTLLVRQGTYNEAIKFYYKANSTNQYFTLSNYPGEIVTIDGTEIAFSSAQEGLVYVMKTNWVHISGLRVINSNMAGVYIGYSDNILIDHMYTHDTVKSGISAWGSNHVTVSHNEITLACNPHPNYPQSEENISFDNVSFGLIEYNYVHEGANINGGAGGEGINLKDGVQDTEVAYNKVDLSRSDKHYSTRLGFGIDAWNGRPTERIKIHDNIAVNDFWGFIVSSEQGSEVHDVVVYNNLALNNIGDGTGVGFGIPVWGGTKDGWKRNIQFTHNTAVGNSVGFRNVSPLNENVLVSDNIFSGNKTSVQLVSGSESQFNFTNNLFYGEPVFGNNTISKDPLFVNTSEFDFHLQTGSPAIGAGSDGSDLGAFPFGVYITSTPPVITSTVIPSVTNTLTTPSITITTTPIPSTTSIIIDTNTPIPTVTNTILPTGTNTPTLTRTPLPPTATRTATRTFVPTSTRIPITPTNTGIVKLCIFTVNNDKSITIKCLP